MKKNKSIITHLFVSLALLFSGASSVLAGEIVQFEFPVLPHGFFMEAFGPQDLEVPMDLVFLPLEESARGSSRHDEDEDAPFLVIEKRGMVFYIHGDEKHLVLDLRTEVLNVENRGLMSIALDPFFAENGYIYLSLIVDPVGDDQNIPAYGRVLRYATLREDDGPVEVIPGTRQILIGEDWSTGILNCSGSHAGADLLFLDDGSLLISTGDGAHFVDVDAGGKDPECFGPGRFPSYLDVGAFRSLDLRTYSGKLLRIDPLTGMGLPDNPFYAGDGTEIRDKIWSVGLRNPFRISPVPKRLLPQAVMIADVGWDLWEEINVAKGGDNFGWPCSVGPVPNMPYRNADARDYCGRSAGTESVPLLSYHHSDPGPGGFAGTCISGMHFYEGEEYPQIYRDGLFISDFSTDRLRVLHVDDGFGITNTLEFGSAVGDPFGLISHPGNGDIVFISSEYGLRRLRYLGLDLPPIAVIEADPRWGGVPLIVNLSAAGSSDPEDEPLEYLWDLGDGTTSDRRELTKTYSDSISYTVVLTVTDPMEQTDSAEVIVTPGNAPPEVTLTSPVDGDYYTDDVPLELVGSIFDPEDDAAGNSPVVHWEVELIHDHHTHPNWFVAEGNEIRYLPTHHGDGTYLRLTLSGTDSRGIQSSRSISLFDASSEPRAHLAGISDTRPRIGQAIQGVGHVEFPGGKGDVTLTWDWGDGSPIQEFVGVSHQEDIEVEHTYGAVGAYEATLTATRDGVSNTGSQVIEVQTPRPAVAVFASLATEREVPYLEQLSIARDITGSLTPRDVEVETFFFTEGEELAEWMTTYLDDGVQDVLVCLDAIPEAVYAFQPDGSLGEEWLDHGNGIVWTGTRPFSLVVSPDARSRTTSVAAENRILDAGPGALCRGRGIQKIVEGVKPTLPFGKSWESMTSLVFSSLGPDWEVEKVFAFGGIRANHSDAILLRHSGGGFFAQFFTGQVAASGATFPRAKVLREFLKSVTLIREAKEVDAPPPRNPE